MKKTFFWLFILFSLKFTHSAAKRHFPALSTMVSEVLLPGFALSGHTPFAIKRFYVLAIESIVYKLCSVMLLLQNLFVFYYIYIFFPYNGTRKF